MATKRARLAQRTLGGEPTLSLPAFAAAVPAAAVSGLAHGRGCASVPDTYLVYCYLCRTGLWDEITPRYAEDTLYLACEPACFPAAAAASRDAAAAAAATLAPAAPETGAHEPTEALEEEEEEDASSSSGEEEPDADAAAAAAAAAEPEVQAFRVRTLMVPLSIATAAPSPARLHQLLRLSEHERGAPVSLGLVDSDGTVIVSYLYAGMVPPEMLEVNERTGEDDDDDEDAVCMAATIVADDGAGGAEGGGGAGGSGDAAMADA